MGSGVLVESLKNKHEAAETDISVGPTSRTLVRMQRTRERCYVPSQCCSYCPITQLREIGTPTLHCTNCRFGLQSEDGAIDPLGHAITPTTRPQVAVQKNRPNCCAIAQLSGQRLNLNLEFTHDTTESWHLLS